jgi:hypothetical protein
MPSAIVLIIAFILPSIFISLVLTHNCKSSRTEIYQNLEHQTQHYVACEFWALSICFRYILNPVIMIAMAINESPRP